MDLCYEGGEIRLHIEQAEGTVAHASHKGYGKKQIYTSLLNLYFKKKNERHTTLALYCV